MNKTAVGILLAGLCAGCATPTPYIEPKDGTTGISHISVMDADRSAGEVVITMIDGQKTSGRTVRVTPGQHTVRITHYPPAAPYIMYGALGAFSAMMDSVTGKMAFTAEPGHNYTVHYSEDTGLPSGARGVVVSSRVKRRFWIQDEGTGARIAECSK